MVVENAYFKVLQKYILTVEVFIFSPAGYKAPKFGCTPTKLEYWRSSFVRRSNDMSGVDSQTD